MSHRLVAFAWGRQKFRSASFLRLHFPFCLPIGKVNPLAHKQTYPNCWFYDVGEFIAGRAWHAVCFLKAVHAAQTTHYLLCPIAQGENWFHEHQPILPLTEKAWGSQSSLFLSPPPPPSPSGILLLFTKSRLFPCIWSSWKPFTGYRETAALLRLQWWESQNVTAFCGVCTASVESCVPHCHTTGT